MLYVTHFKKKSGPTLYCVIIMMLMLTSDCGALARTASTAVVDATSSTVAPFHASTFENFTTRQPAADATDAYIVFGSDAIYCLFLVRQTEVPITAKQTTNNVGLGLDDYVSLMFDNSGNGTNQYSFEAGFQPC